MLTVILSLLLLLRLSEASADATVPAFCPLWRTRPVEGGGYALAAILMIRLHGDDPSQLTFAELTQWLQYINYAGVDHVVLYDAYSPKHAAEEMLQANVSNWPFITYVDWPASETLSAMDRQVAAYEHARTHYADTARWHIAMDIDEYPFAPADTEELFLRRAVERIASRTPGVGEISLQNYLVVGIPAITPAPKWLLRRHPRVALTPVSNLVTPIYKPRMLARAALYNNVLLPDTIRVAPPSTELFTAHVWGQRVDKMGDVTVLETMRSTRLFTEISPLLDVLERCSPFEDLVACDNE